jgi:hypothetical protein
MLADLFITHALISSMSCVCMVSGPLANSQHSSSTRGALRSKNFPQTVRDAAVRRRHV